MSVEQDHVIFERDTPNQLERFIGEDTEDENDIMVCKDIMVTTKQQIEGGRRKGDSRRKRCSRRKGGKSRKY